MILAIDFDGTIVEDSYPAIGALKPGAKEALQQLRKDGYTLILWTCRTGRHLAEAVKFCAEQGIRFAAINQNLRSEVIRHGGSDPRKIGASLYIDDRGLGKLPTWDEIYWQVRDMLPTYADRVAREGYL